MFLMTIDDWQVNPGFHQGAPWYRTLVACVVKKFSTNDSISEGFFLLDNYSFSLSTEWKTGDKERELIKVNLVRGFARIVRLFCYYGTGFRVNFASVNSVWITRRQFCGFLSFHCSHFHKMLGKVKHVRLFCHSVSRI